MILAKFVYLYTFDCHYIGIDGTYVYLLQYIGST